MAKLYTYPLSLRRLVTASISIGGALLVWLVVRGQLNLDAIMAFLLLGILCAWVMLELHSTLKLDENGISYRTFRGRSTLKWFEITDVHTSPHALFIIVAHRNTKIVLHHGEYAGIGTGFEPFEDLRHEVTRHTLPRLSKIWEQEGLPLACRYPGITRAIMLVYAIPLLLIITFFILFVILTEGMVAEKIAFLILGILAIVPFWLRDYRKNHKTLTVTSEGVKQTNGQDIFIQWSEVQEIMITEEALGFGSITVKGHAGLEIQIPRSIQKCGAIIYWLKRYTNLPETSHPIMTEQW
jgi:hypothetical protein